MGSRSGIVFALALHVVLSAAATVHAQLSPEEHQKLDKLLAERDSDAAIARRLQLFADALERYGDPKRRLSTMYGIDMRRARVPATHGVPFLLKYVDNPAESVKRTAMNLLGMYGPEAKAAVPKLRQLMDDPIRAVTADAMLTIARIDPTNQEIATTILDRLGSKASDDATDRAILRALADMASVIPKTAVPRIAAYRTHRWTENCNCAYEAVGKILALERPSLDRLRTLEVIDWRNAPDQGYAILAAIHENGSKAGFAMPLLVELLISEPPLYVQCMALDTLGQMKTGNPRIISFLLDRLVANDLVLREKARRNLYSVDLHEAASVRALAKGLRHEVPHVRYEAAVVLRRWDQEAKLTSAGLAEMFPPLIETLREVNEDVHWGYLDVYLGLLKRFGPKAAPVVENLVRLHTSPTYFQKLTPADAAQKRARLLAALANIGIPEAARPLVWDALKKGPAAELDGGYAYAAAARATSRLGPDARAAIPLLLPALKIQGDENKFMYIDWTSNIGYPYTTARLEAIRALAKFGPDAKDALEPLRRIAAGKAAAPHTLEAAAQREARQAIAAIEGKVEPGAAPK